MLRPLDPPEPPFGVPAAILAAACLGLFALLARAVFALPEAPAELAGLVQDNLADSGLGNAVNAVLINFRAFDTLLEKAVLLLTLAGLWGLAPAVDWRAPSGNFRTHQPAEAELLVLLKVLVPLSLLMAGYLLWLGSDEPGGAFQAGTIVAAVGILLVLGRVLPVPGHGMGLLRVCAVQGFLVFVGAGVATAVFGQGFLEYPVAFAKPIILLIETSLMLAVAATLFLLASGLPDEIDGKQGSRP